MPKRCKKPHPFPGTGALIRQARLAKGLTGDALAALVGSNKGLVSGWETDKVWPHAKKAEALERVLGIKLPRHVRSGRGRISTGIAVCASPECAKEFPTFFGETYCSRACAAVGKSETMKGKNVKTGRTIDVKGYVHVLVPGAHPRKNAGYVREHILVIERTESGAIFWRASVSITVTATGPITIPPTLSYGWWEQHEGPAGAEDERPDRGGATV